MKAVLQLSALVLLVAASDACSCLPTSVPRDYYSPSISRVVRAVVKDIRKPSPCPSGNCQISYRIDVLTAFKGCLKPTDLSLSTGGNSASCGVNLNVGTEYLFFLSSDSVPTISLCQSNQRFSDVSAKDRKFLETRYVCCGDQCKCSPRYPVVNCLLSTCSVSKPPCADAFKCTDNYCGGCLAEWFTKDGFPACLSGGDF